MARNGSVTQGTNEHVIMQLLAENDALIPVAQFHESVDKVLPNRSRKTIYSVTQRMVDEGFIERAVILTAKGREALAASQPRIAKVEERVRPPRREIKISAPPKPVNEVAARRPKPVAEIDLPTLVARNRLF